MPPLTNERTAPRRPTLFVGVLVVACAALGVLVVVLSRQNRQLKADITAMDQALRRTEEALKPGQKLAPLTGLDASGTEVTVPLDAPGRRLLLVGSTQCHSCESVRPTWAELGQRASSTTVESVCLLTDGAPKAHEAAELWMPVLGVRGFRESSIAKLPTVPAVILLRNGVIERIWPGPYDTESRDEVLAALNAG